MQEPNVALDPGKNNWNVKSPSSYSESYKPILLENLPFNPDGIKKIRTINLKPKTVANLH